MQCLLSFEENICFSVKKKEFLFFSSHSVELVIAQHEEDPRCMCDLDEEQVNQLFLKFIITRRNVDEVEAVDVAGTCSAKFKMEQAFSELIEKFKRAHQEDNSLTTSTLMLRKRTEDGNNVWVLYFAFIKN